MICKLKLLRIDKNITQEFIARNADISLRNYQNIENLQCKPNIETVLKICKIINCKVEDIYEI